MWPESIRGERIVQYALIVLSEYARATERSSIVYNLNS